MQKKNSVSRVRSAHSTCILRNGIISYVVLVGVFRIDILLKDLLWKIKIIAQKHIGMVTPSLTTRECVYRCFYFYGSVTWRILCRNSIYKHSL